MHYSIDAGLSSKISNMQLLCIGMVVMQHVPGGSWINKSCGAIMGIAVPFFFLISGFFFVAHAEDPKWWRKAMVKRFSSLAVPYLIACGSWFLVEVFLLQIRQFDAIFSSFGFDLRYLPDVGSLWYVRSLLIYMVLLPLVYQMIVRQGCYRMIFFGGLFAAAFFCQCFAMETKSTELANFLLWGVNLKGFFYFSLGVLMCQGEWRCEIQNRIKWLLVLLTSVACLCCGPIFISRGLVWSRAFHFICMPLIMYLVWLIMPIKKMGGGVFPIYLLHLQLITLMRYLLKSLGIPSNNVYGAFLLFLIGTEGSLLIAEGMRRFTPKLARITFGGR